MSMSELLTHDDAAADVLERLRQPVSKKLKARALSADGYPYTQPLDRALYDEDLHRLQIELAKLQSHIRTTGQRVVAVFEGRDAAGKGGVIKRFTAHLNPRRVRIAALPKPSDVERGQWYFQRYVAHLPSRGMITFFDRSWYNRAGVERVFGFCTQEEYNAFLTEAPRFERMVSRDGIVVLKYWLTIGRETQLVRFHKRATNPLKRWKLSPIDLAAVDLWEEYTDAKCAMMRATHTPSTPWTVIRANDKRRARLNTIRHFLGQFDYEDRDDAVVGAPDPRIVLTGEEEM